MIPKNWDDITIEQYAAIYKTMDETPKNEDEQFNLLVKRVCCITDLDPQEVMDRFTINDLSEMSDLLNCSLPVKIIKRFRFNGHYYKFNEDPTKYKSGEYMSVMNACKKGGADSLHNIIFQVCSRTNVWGKVKPIPDNEISDVIESFKKLPMKIVNPIIVFFYLLSNELTNDILTYSTEQMKMREKELQTEIGYLKGTDG